jgi:hypothetical protein
MLVVIFFIIYRSALLLLIFSCVALRSSFRTTIIKATISLTGNHHFSQHNAQIPRASG